MKNEKMIVVEKSAKWWMSVVASASLAVGVLGGYTIHSLTNGASTANQRSTVQANMPQQNSQQGHQMQGPGGQPPQGQGNDNGMPPQMAKRVKLDLVETVVLEGNRLKEQMANRIIILRKSHQMQMEAQKTKIKIPTKIILEIPQILKPLDKVMI